MGSTTLRALFALLALFGAGCGGAIAPLGGPDGGGDDASTSPPAEPPDAAGPRDNPPPPGAKCVFDTSDYDRSCANDLGCATVTAGDYCNPLCECGGSPIAVSAVAQFNADVGHTPVGSGAIPVLRCSCPFFGNVCCRNGMCGIGAECNSPSDTLPLCAQAGGTCAAFALGCAGTEGPSGSCAYSDEICCIP